MTTRLIKAKVINRGYQKHKLTFDEDDDWLNKHAGCDVDKMMAGDEIEKQKSIAHFENETRLLKERILNQALVEPKEETGIDFYNKEWE